MHDHEGQELERNAASAQAELDYLGLILKDLRRGMDATGAASEELVGLPGKLLGLPFTPAIADLTLDIAQSGVAAMHRLAELARIIDGLSELVGGRVKMIAVELGIELDADEAAGGDA